MRPRGARRPSVDVADLDRALDGAGLARGLLSVSAMALSFIMHTQLERYGVTREVVRGLTRRQPEESWRLPEHLRPRLRLLLQDLGFEASREIWVREVPAQRVFRLFQPPREEESKRRQPEPKEYRLKWLDDVTRESERVR